MPGSSTAGLWRATARHEALEAQHKGRVQRVDSRSLSAEVLPHAPLSVLYAVPTEANRVPGVEIHSGSLGSRPPKQHPSGLEGTCFLVPALYRELQWLPCRERARTYTSYFGWMTCSVSFFG